MWRAQVRNWADRPSEHWAVDARRASRAAGSLPGTERELAEALVAMSEDRHPDACEAYSRVLAQDNTSFAGWFGLGACHWRRV